LPLDQGSAFNAAPNLALKSHGASFVRGFFQAIAGPPSGSFTTISRMKTSAATNMDGEQHFPPVLINRGDAVYQRFVIRSPSGISMTDILTPTERSARMALIRGRNTKPEIVIRRGLHRLGYRYILVSRMKV
jgi:hypothetical protein